MSNEMWMKPVEYLNPKHTALNNALWQHVQYTDATTMTSAIYLS